jgi:ABC-type antimicrobial peptide transport system permease subunit
MPLETAQDLFAPRRASQMLVLQLTPGSDAETVRAKLDQDLNPKGQYAIFYEDTIAKRNTRVLYDVALLVRIIATIALASIIFGTYNLTSLSLEERRRDAGILRALGFSARAISVFLSVRALLLGLLAYVIALVVAWIYITLERNLAPIFILGLPFLFRLSVVNIITSLGWMLILPPLGAWLATRRLLQERVVLSLQRI